MYEEVYLQGLVEKIASGTRFCSSSVRYLGRAHLGKTLAGPIFFFISGVS